MQQMDTSNYVLQCRLTPTFKSRMLRAKIKNSPCLAAPLGRQGVLTISCVVDSFTRLGPNVDCDRWSGGGLVVQLLHDYYIVKTKSLAVWWSGDWWSGGLVVWGPVVWWWSGGPWSGGTVFRWSCGSVV